MQKKHGIALLTIQLQCLQTAIAEKIINTEYNQQYGRVFSMLL